MKNFGGFLLLLSLTTSFPSKAQTRSENFCQKFPLNSKCQNNSLETSPNSDSNDIRSSDSKIVDTLTVTQVQEYLRELGYINFTRQDERGFSFLIEGRPCFVYLGEGGSGLALSSFYYLDKKITLEAINDWNKSFRYSFAFIWQTPENQEAVILQTNLTVIGGVTEERIKNFFVLHARYQRAFSQYLINL